MGVYADLIRYRELFGNLFRRDLQAKYKGSVFGLAWSLANPLMLMGIYVLVFSLLWKVADVRHYPLYLLAGIAVWVFFSTSVSAAARSLVDAAELVKKVRFPRQLVPFSVVATQLVTFVVMLAVVVVADAIVIPEARSTVWLALPLAIPIVALVAGVSLVVACVNVLFRDVEHLVAALLLPWFFLTPVLYRLEQFEQHHTIVQVLRWGNPLTPPIYALRAPLFWGELPRWTDVLYVCVAAVAALALGAWVFSRVDDRIAVEL